MNMLIWNVRGLNHPSKQQEVQRIVRAKRISIACLIETKVKESNSGNISSSMLPGWDFFFNYEKHYLGRIWVCWKREDFVVSVEDKSDQSITCLFFLFRRNFIGIKPLCMVLIIFLIGDIFGSISTL